MSNGDDDEADVSQAEFEPPVGRQIGVVGLGRKWRRGDHARGRGRVPGRAEALVFGALPALCFPAPSWWWLAWVAVVPLLLVVRAAPTAQEGAVRAWWGLAGYVLTTQYWLLPSTGPLLVVQAAGLGALWVPWGWACHRLLSAPVRRCGPGRVWAASGHCWARRSGISPRHWPRPHSAGSG